MTTENIYYNSHTEKHYETMEEFAESIDHKFLNEVIDYNDHPAIMEYDEIEIDAYSDYKRGYTTYLKLYQDHTGQFWGYEYSLNNWHDRFDIGEFQKYKQRKKTIKYWEAA